MAINVPLRMLIMRAYRLSDFRLSGAPSWIDTERYDIVGLAPGATDPEEITPRLQSLLRDRFKLAAHKEEKKVPVFWLVRARNDGRLGPKLHKSTADCPRLSPPLVCIMKRTPTSVITGGSSMTAFANAFSEITGRIVFDRTGLTGLFEADLRWTPDGPSSIGQADAGDSTPGSDSALPSFITALVQQLGLRLESRKQIVEMLVIDRIAEPTEN